MLFNGRNQIPFWYSTYNCKRSSGYHRGVDVMGLDNDIVLSTISGTVQRATVITNRKDPTWEWGWYIRIDEPNGNKHYFCHNEPNSFKVRVGQKVTKGQPIATMGNSGNAALANPPIKHVHYEVRTKYNAYLNPCTYAEIPNAVGTYGEQGKQDIEMELVTGLSLRVNIANKCQCFSEMNVDKVVKWGESSYMPVGNYTVVQKAKSLDKDGFAWCTFKDGSGLLWCVYNISDKRCEIINTPVTTPPPVDNETSDKSEIESLKKKITELENEKNQLNSKIGSLSAENSKLVSDKGILETNLTAANKKYSDCIIKIENAKKALL